MFLFRRKKYQQYSDSELIKLFQESGQGEIIAVIYERYGHLVMGVCLKYLKDEVEAQDMTSKIFEELSQKIRKHTIDYFKGWLHQVVKNECLMFLRKNKLYFVSSDLIREEAEEKQNPELKEKQYALVEAAISSLNEEQANCIRLFYFDDLSYQEISEKLKLDLNQVKSYIQNGKRNLKNRLLQHEEFES